MNSIRLICGQGRCGTSLIMQMLAAGGATVTGEWPAFEDERYQGQLAGQGDWGWLRDLPTGACLKALDADLLNPPLPPEVAERGIFLRRNFYEQARSKVKFLRAVAGIRNGAQEWHEILRRNHRATLAASQAACRTPLADLRFEALIRLPLVSARRLAKALDLPELDLEAAAAVVRRRSPRCYPGLLEAEMIEEREGRGLETGGISNG